MKLPVENSILQCGNPVWPLMQSGASVCLFGEIHPAAVSRYAARLRYHGLTEAGRRRLGSDRRFD
jgi:hypothetical protein